MQLPRNLISPSLLASDFARLGDEVKRVEAAGADWLHVDVMDGHFVPNLTIGPPVVEALKRVATRPLDVHLMISEPARYARDYAKAGAHVLTFHAEVGEHPEDLREVIRTFRGEGIEKVGIAVDPPCAIERVADVLELVDLVLVMSVRAGFGGQKFMPDVLGKVRWLRARGYAGDVEMDGGISEKTIGACAEAGTNVFVAGSAIFGASDIPGTIARMRETARAAQEKELHASS
ncbi:MAG TPA: ribulose-phosphate 3-epimerase [Planctomycetota bacterium]|nr:ribulose-phosphate 3-epimerase [Planctomycetota bacterium]